jgi:hypothetical protein
MRSTCPLVVLAVTVAALAPADAAAREQPTPLARPLTVSCDPVLLTETSSFTPRTLISVRTTLDRNSGSIFVWTNSAYFYAVVGRRSAWSNQKICRATVLPRNLPPAVLTRVARPRLSCAVPGRRLLVHARPLRGGGSTLTVRALPHGSVLGHFVFSRDSRTPRAYASRYALRLCDPNA